MFGQEELTQVVEQEFEPMIRERFESTGFQDAMWGVLARYNSQSGESYDSPTLMPLTIEQPSAIEEQLGIVKKFVTTCEAVASLVAFPYRNTICIHAEMSNWSMQWVIPILFEDEESRLGKLISGVNGEGDIATMLDNACPFGGVWTGKRSRRVVYEA